ncbi:hypothetical protein X566_13955 [Afipia sp. P52-10]|nr:hypothetical protein X566_13955 [Afipia sp. P52-10]
MTELSKLQEEGDNAQRQAFSLHPLWDVQVMRGKHSFRMSDMRRL